MKTELFLKKENKVQNPDLGYQQPEDQEERHLGLTGAFLRQDSGSGYRSLRSDMRESLGTSKSKPDNEIQNHWKA